MNKILIGCFCVIAGALCLTAAKPEPNADFLKRTGGYIMRPGSQKGHIVFIDTQTRLAATNIEVVANSLAEDTRFNVGYQKAKAGEPATLLASSRADLAIIVISDDKSPALLVAPEDRWAVVNVSKMTKNLKSERAVKKFFESRCRKELVRAFSLLCGGGSSQYPGNIMNAAKIEDLDLLNEGIPVDMLANYQTYLGTLGVTPAVRGTYSQACRQGWAPAPTNELQKAVWNRINAHPSNPIKITK